MKLSIKSLVKRFPVLARCNKRINVSYTPTSCLINSYSWRVVREVSSAINRWIYQETVTKKILQQLWAD